MSDASVLVTRGPVSHLVLDRPDRHNALSSAMQAEIVDTLERLAVDDETRVVVLSGVGPSFCSGHDIAEIPSPDEGPFPYLESYRRFYRHVWDFPKPLIAAVHGVVGPAGTELALLADLAIAAESTVFSYEVYRFGGMTPAHVLPWVVGPAQAKRILFTAPRVPAAEALRLGMVTRVVPDGELDERARALGALVAAMPPLHLRTAKTTVNQAVEAMGARGASAMASMAEALIRASTSAALPAGERSARALLARNRAAFESLEKAWLGDGVPTPSTGQGREHP